MTVNNMYLSFWGVWKVLEGPRELSPGFSLNKFCSSTQCSFDCVKVSSVSLWYCELCSEVQGLLKMVHGGRYSKRLLRLLFAFLRSFGFFGQRHLIFGWGIISSFWIMWSCRGCDWPHSMATGRPQVPGLTHQRTPLSWVSRWARNLRKGN